MEKGSGLIFVRGKKDLQTKQQWADWLFLFGKLRNFHFKNIVNVLVQPRLQRKKDEEGDMKEQMPPKLSLTPTGNRYGEFFPERHCKRKTRREKKGAT